MIRMEDLQEAIAECEGQRNPNANTCLKLASLYTILDHKKRDSSGEQESVAIPTYSYASQSSSVVDYESDTEFGQTINGKDANSVFEVMDELMSTLQAMIPRLYDGVLIKLQK